LYKERVSSFDEMTNLPKVVRARLEEKYITNAVELDRVLEAKDGTKKYLCRAADDSLFECVFIPAEDGRGTVCISTQVGCAMDCVFCRTGEMGFTRNLTQGEILGQLIVVMKDNAEPVTNIVLMGMGEPLMNLEAVSHSVEILLDSGAFNISKRRITLSTCGLLPELEEFTKRFDVKIAISLNATNDQARSKIMPINKKYSIEKIMEFCRAYSKRSRHRVTFEYVLMRGINDSTEDANRLVALLKGVKAKVNLIPFNAFLSSEYQGPKEGTAEKWSDILREHNIQSNIRISRGQEILAACGQLATSLKS